MKLHQKQTISLSHSHKTMGSEVPLDIGAEIQWIWSEQKREKERVPDCMEINLNAIKC